NTRHRRSSAPAVPRPRQAVSRRAARCGRVVRVHYPDRMHVAAVPAAPPRTLPRMLNWGRLRFTFIFSGVLGILIGAHWKSGIWAGVSHALLLGLVAMLVFGLFERWPKRLPRWIARWALQVV